MIILTRIGQYCSLTCVKHHIIILSYWTFYGEDNPGISTFNYLKRGFSKQPTDHYYRTMALALRHSGWENNAGQGSCYGDKNEVRARPGGPQWRQQ